MNLETFNIEEDFLETYPELSLVFRELPSRLLWAISLDTHPKSVYRNLTQADRREIIEVEYYGQKIDWEGLKDTIELYKKLCLSKKQKYLIEWENKLDERQDYIASLPYNHLNYEILDKMMGTTEKMWKQYITSLKDVEDEEAVIMGGAQESVTEQGLI